MFLGDTKVETSLIHVPLDELRTNENDLPLGSEVYRNNKVYRFVKNAGATALSRTGPCLELATSVEAAAKKRVISNDGAGAATAAVERAAGQPMTAIAKSGSDTGDHGYVVVAGAKRVSVQQLATALDIGMVCVASQAITSAWLADDVYVTATNHAVIVKKVATTGAATAASALVDIKCI